MILAQCSYSIACAVRFNTIDQWKVWESCLTFFCCLPFGTCVAFIIYFGSEESDWQCFSQYLSTMNLKPDGWFVPKEKDSKLVKFIKRKLDKHLGFILEAAIEAFPQSLLQIIAIVYYQEANYISIISILLSMFSVMSKSLILSQGVEKYTFIWTWLCVVTDFFGIFFTLTWVFYTNDNIHGDLFGYFNIFGAVWLYKFAISTLLPVALGTAVFLSVVYIFGCGVFLFDPISSNTPAERCGWTLLWIIFGMY